MLEQIIKATKLAVRWCLFMEQCPNCNIELKEKTKVLGSPDDLDSDIPSNDWVAYMCDTCFYVILHNERTGERINLHDKEVEQ